MKIQLAPVLLIDGALKAFHLLRKPIELSRPRATPSKRKAQASHVLYASVCVCVRVSVCVPVCMCVKAQQTQTRAPRQRRSFARASNTHLNLSWRQQFVA